MIGCMAIPDLEVYEKRLREVFDPDALEFNAILARLSVLFEDLRIEEYASRLDGLDQLDEGGKGYRKIYFLRRSIATLVEFASAIEMLDQRPEFRKLKKGFNADSVSRWNEAVNYFREGKRYLSEIRADFGAHFDHESARHAIKEMHPDTIGALVVVKHVEEQTGGVRLKYAMEIVGAAMTRRKPADQEDRAYFHEMFVVVRAGSLRAVEAIHTLSVVYLLQKFGRDMT
jgi:hypothetical protein